MSSHKVVRNPDPARLTLRGGRGYLERLSEQLQVSSSVFVTSVEPKAAYYYKRRLAKLLEAEVIAEPGRYDGVDGYSFRVKKKA